MKTHVLFSILFAAGIVSAGCSNREVLADLTAPVENWPGKLLSRQTGNLFNWDF